MKRYLLEEQKVWATFLDHLRGVAHVQSLPFEYGGTFTADELANSINQLLEVVDDERKFNQVILDRNRAVVPPPPSGSTSGQLILGLFGSGWNDDAVSAYLAFLKLNMNFANQLSGPVRSSIEKGKQLQTAGVAASVLPFNKVSSQKINGAVQKSENLVEVIREEAAEAEAINSEHSKKLEQFRSDVHYRCRRLEKILVGRERGRKASYTRWLEETKSTVLEEFSSAQKKA